MRLTGPVPQQIGEGVNFAIAILENIPVPILITDLHAIILWANQAFTDATGYTFADTKGDRPRMFREVDQDHGFDEILAQALAEDGAWQGEIWTRRKNGEAHLQWLTMGPIRDGKNKITHFIATFVDISSLKQSEAEVRHLAYHDSLTGLPNRLLFSDRLGHALSRCKRHGIKIGILYFDLDGFKDVNDSYGHDVGDELLQAVATRLKETLRAEDTLARLGGDEFGIVAADVLEEQAACRVAERILDAFRPPFAIREFQVSVGASIGVVVSEPHRFSADELLNMADEAMYQAKAVGKNRYAIIRGFRPKSDGEVFDPHSPVKGGQKPGTGE